MESSLNLRIKATFKEFSRLDFEFIAIAQGAFLHFQKLSFLSAMEEFQNMHTFESISGDSLSMVCPSSKIGVVILRPSGHDRKENLGSCCEIAHTQGTAQQTLSVPLTLSSAFPCYVPFDEYVYKGSHPHSRMSDGPTSQRSRLHRRLAPRIANRPTYCCLGASLFEHRPFRSDDRNSEPPLERARPGYGVEYGFLIPLTSLVIQLATIITCQKRNTLTMDGL